MSLPQSEFTMLTAHHALQLRRLIGDATEPRIATTGSKEIMLAAMRAAEIDILATFALIPEQERSSLPICGLWTLYDLVGHLADWDRYLLNWLDILRGQAPQDLYWVENGDAFNEWLWQQRRGASWDTAWRDFRARRAEFVDALDQVPAHEFLRVQPSSTYVSYSTTIYHCAWSALEHYLDHAAGVRRTLGLALPEELLYFHGPYT